MNLYIICTCVCVYIFLGRETERQDKTSHSFTGRAMQMCCGVTAGSGKEGEAKGSLLEREEAVGTGN